MVAALQVRDVTKRYGSKTLALDGISLTVEEGDFFALLGPNGAGKTTLIGIISSLVNKTSGQLSVFSHDLDKNRDLCKRLIGIVPQEINFNGFERVDQILINQAGYYGIPYRAAKRQAEKVLKQLGIWEKRKAQGRMLSGGMKRRLMIARALMHDPQLLLLDEPTAGVDVELRHATWQLMSELNQQGLTIILTTHYLEEAEQLCRNIAIIDHGRIIENTDMQSLLHRVSSQVLVITLIEPLTEAPQLSGFNTTLVAPNTLEVIVEKGVSINHIFTALTAAKLSVEHINIKQNRLETLFVELTARTL